MSPKFETLCGPTDLLLYTSGQLFYALVYNSPKEWGHLALSVVACIFPSHIQLAIVAHCAYVARCLWLAPYIFNGEIWATTMDIGFLGVVLTFLGVKRIASPLASVAERDALARELTPVIGNMLVWFYLGAGVWKANWGFLDTQGSCAPIYILQLLDAYLPEALMPPMVVIKFVSDTAPALVILVEAGIGVLMHVPGRVRLAGVALGVLLHGLIAITPGPNNAGGFGVMLLVRYYFFLPDAFAQTLTEIRDAITHGHSQRSLWGGAALVLATSIPGLLRGADHVFFIDWSIPIYAVQTLLFSRALVLQSRAIVAAEQQTGNAAGAAAAGEAEGSMGACRRRCALALRGGWPSTHSSCRCSACKTWATCTCSRRFAFMAVPTISSCPPVCCSSTFTTPTRVVRGQAASCASSHQPQSTCLTSTPQR